MPELTPSTREAARRIGITETALRKAEQTSRIAREPDGQWDIDNAYDNAMAEAFFATLECELLDRRSFRAQAEARMAVFAFIEGFHNPTRRHAALRHLLPIEYEARAMAEND